MGGIVRHPERDLQAMKDPVTFDNTFSHFTHGWLEYLVSYNNDGTFTPELLEGWEVSEDASPTRSWSAPA
jgi:peptide/nickel transport system substrate-binding protein